MLNKFSIFPAKMENNQQDFGIQKLVIKTSKKIHQR